MYFTPLKNITLNEKENEKIMTFITSIDENEEPAREEFERAYAISQSDPEQLYRDHMEKFSAIWEEGRIEVDDLELQSVIYSSYYYIISSLPALRHNGKLNQFYGLSPGSLSRGALYSDYQGHSFWDTGNTKNFLI